MSRGIFGYVRRQPVAFVALFFALGGSAVAGSKYLTASDQITQGDLAGSTYGNPVIASGAVTNTKLANPSLSIAPGTGLTGGGSVALGGSTMLGIADGGIGTTQLADGAVTTAKFDPGAEAPNSAELGGIGPDGFIQGTGRILANRVSVPPTGTPNAGVLFSSALGPLGLDLYGFCQSSGAATVQYLNNDATDVWWSHNGGVGYGVDTSFHPPFANFVQGETTDDLITAHLTDGTHFATLVIAVHPGSSTANCIFSAQAVVQ